MSRGLGSAQREVLAYLADLDGDNRPGWHPLAGLLPPGPDRASHARGQVVRRAARTLERDGYVKVSHRADGAVARVWVKLTSRGRATVQRSVNGEPGKVSAAD